MALGASIASPRYSAIRGHSVMRQRPIISHGGPVPRISGVRAVGAPRTIPGRRPVGAIGGGGAGARGFRAASEPPLFRSTTGLGSRSTIPQRKIYDYDNIENEYAQVMADLSISKTRGTAQDNEDLHSNSRARDRALLSNANSAVANASVRPIVNRRIASRVISKGNPGASINQVDEDGEYISSLYPEFDIPIRSMGKSIPPKISTSNKIHKLGSRPVGARAKANMKRNQMYRKPLAVTSKASGNAGNIGRQVPLKNRAFPYKTSVARRMSVELDPELLFPTRAMSVPPLSTVKRETVRRALSPAPQRKTMVSMYETAHVPRKVISKGARDGAAAGSAPKGRVAAVVLSRGKQFRHMRDYKTPIQPLYYDEHDVIRPKALLSDRERKQISASSKARVPSRAIYVPGGQPFIAASRKVTLNEQPRKAALLAPTIEIETRRRKSPKSTFGAAKMRELDLISRDSAVAGLHASAPGAKKRGDRRLIRTEEGYTKPSSVMSWKSRVDARIDKDDGIFVPASLSRLRDRLREAQDKMDSHRQMIDRYLDTDVKPASKSSSEANIMNRLAVIEQRNPRVPRVKSAEPESLIITKKPGETTTDVVTTEGD